MDNQLLRHLIAHVVTELTDMSVGFGKTKLVKLLYLIDVENYRRRGATISGLEWRFYHYGPYAFEIDAALKELSLDVPQDSVTLGTGHKATIFRPNHGLRPRLGEYVSSPAELGLVDRIVRDWGEVEFNALLNHVYFFTEPMKHAERGEVLDFSAIQSNQSRAAVHNEPMPAGQVGKYNSQFQEAKAKRVRRPLYPAPRFDRVYQDGLARMTAEEASGVPFGAVDISAETKESLREQRDSEVGG